MSVFCDMTMPMLSIAERLVMTHMQILVNMQSGSKVTTSYIPLQSH